VRHSHGTTIVDRTSEQLQTGLKLAETDQNWLAGWKKVTINSQNKTDLDPEKPVRSRQRSPTMTQQILQACVWL